MNEGASQSAVSLVGQCKALPSLQEYLPFITVRLTTDGHGRSVVDMLPGDKSGNHHKCLIALLCDV